MVKTNKGLLLVGYKLTDLNCKLNLFNPQVKLVGFSLIGI